MAAAPRRSIWPVVGGLALLLAILAALALWFAPYVFVEVHARTSHYDITDPAPAKIAKGRMFDDYWQIQSIGPDTFAIGEPRFYQQNYSYLILGRTRALMFDAGSGTRNIMPVIRSLTTLPVTVIPSHLHSDHTGGIGVFDHVALIDLPRLRAETRDGVFHPGPYEFLGQPDHKPAPAIRVTEWLAPGAAIDLGGRRLQVLNTPGHTPTSVSLYDAGNRMLFTGDYIYPTTLYAFAPGASLSAYSATARSLLASLPADTILWTAHCCRAGEDPSAPWLTMADLKDLSVALDKLARGETKPKGAYPFRSPVSRQMTLATAFPWNNR